MAFLSKIVKANQTIEENSKISEEMIFENIEQELNKWSIPKMNPTKVDNKVIFEFRQTYIIKTLEKNITISKYRVYKIFN